MDRVRGESKRFVYLYSKNYVSKGQNQNSESDSIYSLKNWKKKIRIGERIFFNRGRNVKRHDDLKKSISVISRFAFNLEGGIPGSIFSIFFLKFEKIRVNCPEKDWSVIIRWSKDFSGFRRAERAEVASCR